MFQERTSVGLDVHARSVVAAAIDGVTGEVRTERLIADNDVVIGWVAKLAGPVAVAYEAGPTGYGLYRSLTAAGIDCVVAAPSRLIRPAGDRVKTDVRDAVLLARLLRMGEIVPVTVPTIAQESARDLVRAREDIRRELMSARHRVGKLLLRHGHVYSGGTTWNREHDAWLRRLRFDQVGTTVAFDAAYESVVMATARRDRLDEQIAVLAANSEYTAVTHRLACLRGISTLTAFALAVEIGDWQRLTGGAIGSYLGLVPSEHSSGDKRSQGGITKTGNSHARRLLIESAWHHRPAYRPGKTMLDRWALAPAPVVARADAGNRRLHRRWVQLEARKKKHTVITTAIAREIAGWCWSLAVMDG
ncbi:MAG: IS110 family transposase [Dermatophilaceae bacterium]